MSFEDRRTYERFQAELSLDCSQENSKEEYSLFAHDISAEGLGVISEKELSPGTEVNMSLHLPGVDKELSAKAK
jgi:c-di-GMP-binding flagellar brake protein YcgR